MRRTMSGAWVVFAVVILSIALLAGCAGRKMKAGPSFWEYAMPEATALDYQVSQQMKQTMELMGQTMEMSYDKDLEFSVTTMGRDQDVYKLEITVSALEAGATTPQGDFEADAQAAIGKTFEMHLSNLGKEVDVSGAKEIKFGMGPEGERSIMPDFAAIFPDLPGKPVKVGDTWTSRDVIPIEEGNMTLELKSESVHTLLGFEKMDGVDCAKIMTIVTGSISGEGEQMGAPLVFKGTLEGNETWYFAHNEGRFVKQSGNIVTIASVEVQAPQPMTIPITMDMTTTTELTK